MYKNEHDEGESTNQIEFVIILVNIGALENQS